MGWFSEDSEQAQAYDAFQSGQHEAKISHELIAGAAAYEAAKAFEQHEEHNGQIQSHAEAKEVIAGIIGAFVDREVETKGLDFLDREKAKRLAQEHAEDAMAMQGRW